MPMVSFERKYLQLGLGKKFSIRMFWLENYSL